ncbi:hypothetical protein AB0B45_02190 [Nonomuraea sp. NPDC049152]|uniref:hypothetical protein n=1 Tax=Nonomuraea sp. NPDC049152 TaxID=3154350 RepID=UPI0033E2CDEC
MSGDDLDARFNELVAQIDATEQRRMRTAATKGARAPRRSRSRRRRWPAVWAVVAVVAAAGVLVAARPDLLSEVAPAVRQAAPAPGPVPGPVPEETEPVAVRPEKLGPFDGSKAEKYAEGVAGIVLPKAKAMGGLSKKEVAKGLKRAKALLAAAYLDRAALMGGKPKAFVAALDPAQRADFRKHLDLRGKEVYNSRDALASFAPKTAELVTDVIKTNGRITLAKDRHGVLVKVNHVFVYAVQRPGAPDTAMRLVVHAKGEVLLQRVGGRVTTWARLYRDGATPARCDVDDGFIHPFYDDSAPDTTSKRSDEPPSDPYDLDEKPTRKKDDAECSASQPT